MKKLNLNTLHIGIEFEVDKTNTNKQKLLQFSKYLNTKLEIDGSCYEVQTKPILYNNKTEINNILEFYNSLSIKPCYYCGTHIHFSIYNNTRYILNHCTIQNYYIIKYITSLQNDNLTKIMGRNFNNYCKKFTLPKHKLPTKLSSYSKKHWINITQYTIEFRLPLFLSIPQYIETINLCYNIYKQIENISNQ